MRPPQTQIHPLCSIAFQRREKTLIVNHLQPASTICGKRFFILSRTEKGVLQSLHPVPVSGKTIAKKGDGFARSHPLQVPEKISTVHSYATDFRLCLHTVQPSCDG